MLRSSFVLPLAALLAVGLAFGVVACGTPSSKVSPGGSFSHPTGAADVVLRVSMGGGMHLPEYDWVHVPEFTLFGDGRIILGGGASTMASELRAVGPNTGLVR